MLHFHSMSADTLEATSQGPYAPFGKRLAAFCIDLIVLGLFTLMAQFTVPYLAPFIVWVLYKTVFECSAIQATPGKRAMDIIVTDMKGRRLTIGKSLLRTLVAFLSIFTFFAIYLLALFMPRRQALHDIVADTQVVNGRTDVESGKAWMDEMKFLYEWIRALFNSSGRSMVSESEKLALLEKLNALRTSGALTDAEFQTRKRAILGD